MKLATWGGRWLVLLLLALRGTGPVQAQSTPQSTNDASFLAILGELREATYSDKATIVERLSKSGHPNIRNTRTWPEAMA